MHREALKQSATDPLSGKIDVGILTTGLSTTARKKQADLVANIKNVLKMKGKVPTVSWNKLLTELNEKSQIVSKKKKFRLFVGCHKIISYFRTFFLVRSHIP